MKTAKKLIGLKKLDLVDEVLRLQLALARYTDATIVTDWGMEELSDAGQYARQALGYGDHASNCPWPNGYADNPETGDYEFMGTDCTCGLEDLIRAACDKIADALGVSLNVPEVAE